MNDLRAIMESRRYVPMSPIDRARHYTFLRKQGFTVTEMADDLNEKKGKVYRYLRLLKLPTEVQKQVHEGRISMTEALKGKS